MTTWTNEQRLEGSPIATYNDATITYSQADKNYQGQSIPVWTKETIS